MAHKPRRWRAFGIGLALLALGIASVSAQRANHIRTYRAAGTYSAAVSFGPGGSVVARAGDAAILTVLDGFTRRDQSLPEESYHRVYQSRSGQLWTVSHEGLLLYHNGQWSSHPLVEVRNELMHNIRPLRQLSIVPAEVNRVFILFPDRLIDYEATTRQVRTIRAARDTRLGQFTEMQEGMDESIWISGMFGVARIGGPLRRMGPDSDWREYPLANTNEVNMLQRPFEFPAGQVTVSANRVESEARFILQLREGEWSYNPIAAEKVRQAWTGWDEYTWGFSFNSLFRLNPNSSNGLLPEPVYGRQYDVAVEPSGAFWIAASEGLVRYAPFLWHAPHALESLNTPVHSFIFDPGTPGALWLSIPEGMLRAEGNRLSLVRWPEELEVVGGPRGQLYRLSDGRIVVATPGRPVIFSPETGAFEPLQIPGGAEVDFVGELGGDRLVAAFEETGQRLNLQTFDGANFAALPLPELAWSFGEVTFVEEGLGGDLWVGGATGMAQVRTNGTLELHGTANGLPGDAVLAVANVGEGRVWCGTETVVSELRGQRWRPVLNALDRVQRIVRAQDSIWVGTAGGVYRYVNESWIFYGANEGLGSPLFTLQRDASDQLWAGTGRGVAVFHPHADPDPPRALPPTLLEATQPSTVQPTVIRFHGQDKWDYTAPGDLLFSYKLDETPWTPFSNITSRTFPNLSSGSHVLQVLAMDRNGNRSPVPAEITFSLIVPWFKDPRLLFVSVLAGTLTLILAGLAVNKHLQLKHSYAEVEKIVAERTRELEKANRELLHGQKMRAIGTMAAGVAHDFNNILSIIKGSAQIIESNPNDKEKIRTRVNRIQTVVEQGTTIVKALLGLGRISEKDLAPCDVGALLHETRRLLSDRFPESVEIHIDAAPGLPRTLCAQEVLQQMLLNLILNAVDAIGGQGLVLLKAELTNALPGELVLDPAPTKSYIAVSVVDEGVGIAPENVTRIFEPFFTTKAFSSRRGTGLGLSMVYELAKGFGYGLNVETKPGEGSTFSIILPVTEFGD